MSYLTDYKEIDRGYVAFGGNSKGGKITGKCTIKTRNLDFKNVDLSSKLFENDQACVACQKGKQHRASCTKDETSSILKFFITRIENLVDHKVKTADPPFSQDPKSSQDDGSKPLSDHEKKVDEDPRKENECNDQEKEDNVNSTNNFNIFSSTVNAAGTNKDNELPFDLNMPALEDVSIFNFLNDDEDDDVVADMNNLDTTIQIKEEVYVCQPPGFEDPDFPDRVYKVEKHSMDYIKLLELEELTIFMGLQVKQNKDGIFISQDKYVAKILKKFGFTKVKTASIPMETQKPLLKDEDGEEVDVHMYRSMISSLIYLTSSRPDNMFVVSACARYQVNPKVSHLHVVKRTFRYLKGQPKLGLWYLKDSPFDLVAYTDSDYVGASLDMKSTTGSCQFLKCRLISWQCKKQTMVSNSITEAKYVAASSCCGQVLWIQNQLLDYG
nr:hypothetical protein [Tanacetum cinerariifolium]